MIHTCGLTFKIEKEDIIMLEKNIGDSYKKLNDRFQFLYGEYFNYAYTTQVTEKFGKWHLSLFVDVVRLLNKSDIYESDYRYVKSSIKEFLVMLLGHARHYENHVLKRIDYRYDVILADTSLRDLYFHLIGKHVNQYRRQKKYKGKINTNSGKYEDFGTTVYHSTKKSVVTCCYDKEAERIAKGCSIEPYEQNVIRFEVRLLYEHLRYKSGGKCKTPIMMHLESYFNESLYYQYLQQYLLPIYPQGDYYTYKAIEDVIHNADIKFSDKQILKTFLLKTSSYSLSTPKKHMSPYMYKKAMQLLQNLRINPVPIPKNYPKAPKHFANPLNPLYAKYV